MAAVTVCIPAYDVGSAIAETLQSLARQTFRDFGVRIGVEPPGPVTARALAPFRGDARIQVQLNARRLGWDGNVHALLRKVRTEYFMVLSHDDEIAPDYIATLIDELRTHMQSPVAYGDIYCFGAHQRIRHGLNVPLDASLPERLIAFFLHGAEGAPWRGLTRSTCIARCGGFPRDGFGGFAAECEWALSLLLEGPPVHVGRPLFGKRYYPPTIVTASRARLCSADLSAAHNRHRKRMLSLAVSRIDGADHKRVTHAAEAALLRRYARSLGLPFPEDVLRRAYHLMERAAGPVQAMIAADLARHDKIKNREAAA